MHDETLYQRQLKREQLQVDAGVARYRAAVQSKEATDLKPGQALLRRSIEPVANAIREMVVAVETGKAGRGRPALAVRYLQQLQDEPVAFITARRLINAAVNNEKVTKVAMALASLLGEHYQFDELRAAEPNLSTHMERKAKKWSTEHHRRAIMRLAADVGGVSGLEWSQGDKLHLGMKLIEIFISTTGLAKQVLVSEGRNNTHYILAPTEAANDWLARMHERCELMEPRYLPMVHPPKPWTSPISGGYLTRENRADFVGGVTAQMRDDMFSVEMPKVYAAVNAIQNTRWKVNTAVYDVLAEAWAGNDTLHGLLPDQELVYVPERPADIPADMKPDDMPVEMRTRFNDWRVEAAKAHEKNAKMIAKRVDISGKLSMAKDVRDEEAIYFPHVLDFRGRIYSMVSGMHPQADSLGKALLHFADGKPLGESGAFWLHVHIANTFGIDKVDFPARVQWVQEHHEQLLDSALNPLDGRRFWLEADAKSKWCALAACIEYAGYVIDGVDHISHLPIPMDGSCSGLQHYSAMLKDPEGGAAVNLVPSDKPADIYIRVADKTEELLLNAKPDEQCLISWRGKVKRKLTKQPCMTFAYSVTARGMRDQINAACRKMAEDSQTDTYLPGWTDYEAASAIAPVVEASIRATVKRAALAMDWMKDAVKPVTDLDMPPLWTTHDGLPIQHRYVKTNGKRFKVWFGGMQMKIQLRVESVHQDPRKHKAAIAPNYIHGNDATHLRMTVNRLVEANVTDSFAMIHDSFGVHACHVDDMNFAIREQFVELYSTNQLERFRQQMIDMLPPDKADQVPPPPAQGDLDLSEVMEADFFFA
ncbi:DNA-directed RNA polymerase [Microbulbifer sp. 2201CG32-9]|uniref:DNA-directed RNA polymerase n=1 Tax=Microbulbifer sp. 2201CG32-9 TaxID=3232309 RepID=UPI00345B8BA5